MGKTRSCRALVMMVVLTLAPAARVGAQPAPPEEQDSPEKLKARALLKEGVRQLNEGKPAQALTLFDEAYAIFPSAKILINVGRAHVVLGHPAEAADAYQRYLESPDAEAQWIEVARDALVELDRSLGRVAIHVEGAAADVEISIDGGPWVVPRVGVLRVKPGEHVIRARDGERTVEQQVSVGAGAQETVELYLTAPDANPAETPAPPPDEPALAPPPALSSEPRAPSRWTGRRKGAVVAAAVGVGMIGGMSVLGLRASSEWDDAQAQDDDALRRDAKSHADQATILGAVGILSLGAATFLWITGAPPERTSVAAHPLPGGGGGIVIVGSF